MSKTPAAPLLDAALVWCRRDLRAHDHAALHHALRAARKVWVAFVFDTEILAPLLAAGLRADRRVEFIRESLVDLDGQLRTLGRAHGTEGVGLIVRHGAARDEIPRLAAALHVQAVYANADYEPYARERDAHVRGKLAEAGVALHTGKDQAVFDTDELLTGAGSPYGVFTPYKNAWLKKLEPFYVKAYPVSRHAHALAPLPDDVPAGVVTQGVMPQVVLSQGPLPQGALPTDAVRQGSLIADDVPTRAGPSAIPTLADIGFEPTNLAELKIAPGTAGARAVLDDFLGRIDRYEATRNFPAVKGPSYLSVHLRFGTLSVRELASLAWDRMRAGSRGAEVWVSELIWRDFYFQVLHHHPRVVTGSFKPEYDKIKFERGKQADALFAAWCEGRTGYPLIDAAMAQINQTGYMHNRLRMVTASFLCKDLGIDWRRGERYFADQLNDYDLASNNGGWQWASSSGCDAQPYFRIFNPVSQSQKFDADGKFIRRYLPQLSGLPDELLHAPWTAKPVDLEAAGVQLGRDYPEPVVQHEVARLKTLERYAVVKAAR